MKNSFQFFFTPLLSFALLFLFILINFLVGFCGKTIPIISGYLQPRGRMHAGAYTLVQALPVSFFFFAQLNDTRYNHPNSPNATYPSFNTGMAYAAFFASALIPLLLLAKTYERYNLESKVGNFILKMFKGNAGKGIVDKKLHQFNDPIWGGSPTKPASYAFGGSVFFLPLIIGFFLAFFISSYPWQFTGLILFNLLFLSFAAASSHFDNNVFKYYFIGVTGLMIIYELVHAGIGSNRALSTIDQFNTGYIGIGVIYAMLITALVFSVYLLYRTLNGIVKGHKNNGYGFVTDLDQMKKKGPDQNEEEAVVLRNEATGLVQQKKNTLMKSRIQSHLDFNPISEDRMLSHRDNELTGFKFGPQRAKQRLLMNRIDGDGSYIYVG